MAQTAILPRAAFRTALAQINKAVMRKSAIPILANVRLVSGPSGFTVTGTDLDVEMTARIPGAVADDGFALTLPGHLLADLEKKALASDSVAIDMPEGENGAALDFMGLRVSMQSLPESDFPTMELTGKISADFDMDRGDLLSALEAVAFAISTEETRYYLNGIYMHITGGKLAFVATDGHRLAYAERTIPDGAQGLPGILIPRHTVALLMGLLKAKGAPSSVHVKVNTVKSLFTVGNVELLTKHIDGTFPDYARVIPSNPDRAATFNRAELVTAIKAVSAMSSERGRAVRLSMDFDVGSLKLSVSNPDSGTSEMRAALSNGSGAPLEIGFNARYALDVLDHCKGDDVRVKFGDSGSPALFSAIGDTSARFVLMPMRV